MAGQKFEYDESGSTFLYFLISFLGLALVPSTFYFWPAESVQGEDCKKQKDVCRCSGCIKKEDRMKKPEKWKGIKKNCQRLILVLGWCFLAFLVYRVQEFDYEYANFDPYDILSVSMQASQADIKKAYRKLSLVLHPDKPTGDERQFMKLNKAYQALTDDTARRNYELYGNPDGPGAMHFGIALPSWIVSKENSIWVLLVYVLMFMVAMPTVVSLWWFRSSKFSNDQVLLDTTQLYYYFFHKNHQVVFKRALMILAASLEFERGHNPEIKERYSDNIEVPQLIKQLPFLGEKNKERPLCYPYSIKARALVHAHLARITLNESTLDLDRLYIVKMAPALINEMVTCVSQLIMLAHAGRISRLPSLESIEAVMKLSPHIVQALTETKNPLMQLPHVTDDTLRYFFVKKRPIKSISHFASLPSKDRRQILKSLTDDEYNDVMRVVASLPNLEMTLTYEVVDDDDTGVFTAGAIVTVTVTLRRMSLGDTIIENTPEASSGQGGYAEEDETREKDTQPAKSKDSGWKPPTVVKKGKLVKKKNPAKGKGGHSGPPSTPKKGDASKESKTEKRQENNKKGKSERAEDVENDSDYDDTTSHSDESIADEADTESHRDEKNGLDEDAEWEKFQRGLTKREKVLEGKSKNSHTVHSPYFTDDKQEYWWAYICDRKKHMLITAPYQITNLVTEEEVQLKFTAPPKPGVYTFQVCVRSDSYLGFDLCEDIKLDVKEAQEIPTEHPQWEEFSSEEEEFDDEGDCGDGDHDSEFATDEELTEDSD